MGNNSGINLKIQEIICQRKVSSENINVSVMEGSKNKLFSVLSNQENSILLLENNEKTVTKINENGELVVVQNEEKNNQLLFYETKDMKYYLGGDGEYYGGKTFLCYENSDSVEEDFVIKWGSFQLPLVLLHKDGTNLYILFNMETIEKLKFEHSGLKLKIFNVKDGFILKYTDMEDPLVDHYEKCNSSVKSEFSIVYPENADEIITQKNWNSVLWHSKSGEIFIQKLKEKAEYVKLLSSEMVSFEDVFVFEKNNNIFSWIIPSLSKVGVIDYIYLLDMNNEETKISKCFIGKIPKIKKVFCSKGILNFFILSNSKLSNEVKLMSIDSIDPKIIHINHIEEGKTLLEYDIEYIGSLNTKKFFIFYKFNNKDIFCFTAFID
ncbi:MAG: hypothetical protein KAH01_06160 [Caldisericia bacterium]|nr:hypothetical protein [Caldisericia bacterium]